MRHNPLKHKILIFSTAFVQRRLQSNLNKFFYFTLKRKDALGTRLNICGIFPVILGQKT